MKLIRTGMENHYQLFLYGSELDTRANNFRTYIGFPELETIVANMLRVLNTEPEMKTQYLELKQLLARTQKYYSELNGTVKYNRISGTEIVKLVPVSRAILLATNLVQLLSELIAELEMEWFQSSEFTGIEMEMNNE